MALQYRISISLSSIPLEVFRQDRQPSCFNFCSDYIEFFFRKMSYFDVLLIINNFRDRFFCNSWELSKQILKTFFPQVYPFFLAGSLRRGKKASEILHYYVVVYTKTPNRKVLLMVREILSESKHRKNARHLTWQTCIIVRRIPKTINLEKVTKLLIKILALTNIAVMCLSYLIYFIQFFIYHYYYYY